jgi:hypothetical protein
VRFPVSGGEIVQLLNGAEGAGGDNQTFPVRSIPMMHGGVVWRIVRVQVIGSPVVMKREASASSGSEGPGVKVLLAPERKMRSMNGAAASLPVLRFDETKADCPA